MLGILALIKTYELYSMMADAKRREDARTERLDRVERKQTVQDAKLAKHDQQIGEIQFKIEQLEATVNDMDQRLAGLYAKLDYLHDKQDGTSVGGDEWMKYQDKIMAVENQISAAEAKRRKAKHDRLVCRRKLEVA